MNKSFTKTKIVYLAKHCEKWNDKWHDALEFKELEEAKDWVDEMNKGRPNYYKIFEKITTVVETEIDV